MYHISGLDVGESGDVSYRAPTPVSFPVSHPSGVCKPVLLGPTPPTPSASGLAAVKDCFLADAA
jgi:hypothetical protein